jgi:hypothetical protein
METLKDVLEAQKSGELDLLPGSPFNESSPLTIEDGAAGVMMDGDPLYGIEINKEALVEAVELFPHDPAELTFTDTTITRQQDNVVLFKGEDIEDLFNEIVSTAGIYTERY